MIARPHALLTIVAPLAIGRLHDAEAEIDRLPAALPTLKSDLEALDPDMESGTHFMSLHAIASTDGSSAYLLLELSGDGDAKAALARLVSTETLEQAFRQVFLMASDWRDGDTLRDYWTARLLKTGSGYFMPPGLGFVGAPGLAVGRIRNEGRLFAKLSELLGNQQGGQSALDRLGAMRAELATDGKYQDMLKPADAGIDFTLASPLSAGVATAWIAACTYLWPLFALVLLGAIGSGAGNAWGATSFKQGLAAFLMGVWHGLWVGAPLGIILLLVALSAAYAAFRANEARDLTDDRAADYAVNAAMFERENKCAQNHMISITQRKPGLLRAFTSRLVFLIIGSLATRIYQPGFLDKIGTIHFARWITPRGSRDLIFLSNYDGSWESYLEDFITRAHQGLTAVWSNTIGFPRAENLFQKGATDGERFKRFSRRSMMPTRFWYSAYPNLTVAAIRRNAEVRRGLSGALNEDEATEWFALFGSARRPDGRLVSSGIQSLVFGGMGFMPFGTCLVFNHLPADPATARGLLKELLPLVAFNDGRLAGDFAVTLALGADGMARLGLPKSAMATFPFAFLDGMTGDARRRILGDEGTNAPENWRWGKVAPDVALLVYGKSEKAVTELEAQITAWTDRAGLGAPHRILLMPLQDDKREPFGFVDGISQPAIRGTYKGLRNADPIHLVEPGEFILGYPDNRGSLPPGPAIASIEDPANLLPLAVRSEGFDRNSADGLRDLGFNGSFLVIRELEQDVSGFRDYCEAQAAHITGQLPSPYQIDKDFIAAKLMGRWPDGSSLVRNPYEPASSRSDTKYETMRPKPAEKTGTTSVEPPSHGTGARQAVGRGDNNFLFGEEDPEGVRCPYGAHVRRANPRDSLDPGSADQIAISNRHRILRVGRPYAPESGRNPGLLFMCLNGDIERQFEFLQQTWLRNASFHRLSCEKDPLLGNAEAGVCGYTIPSRAGPVALDAVPQFVTVKGGGYFFLPGKRLLDYLVQSA